MKRKVIFYIVGLCCVLLAGNSQGQTQVNPIADPTFQRLNEWSAGMYAGYLMAHHPDLVFLSDGHSVGGSATWAHRTNGSKAWHHYFNFPSWGVDLDAYGLGSENLGFATAARVFWDLPLNPSKSLHWKMGIGPGFVSKPFDAEENIQNSAVGSYLNASLGFELYFRFKLSQRLELKPGLALHHYSNGALKMPNSGLNYLMLHTVLAFASKGFDDPERLKPEFPKGAKHWRVGFSVGAKQGQDIQSPYYGVANVFGMWDIRISPKSIVGGELGLNYNATLATRVEGESDPSLNYRAYIAALYQLCFGNLGIRFSAGTYIAPKFTDDGAVFLRYHILYEFERFQLFGGLKSHYAKADHFEIGTAIKLK